MLPPKCVWNVWKNKWWTAHHLTPVAPVLEGWGTKCIRSSQCLQGMLTVSTKQNPTRRCKIQNKEINAYKALPCSYPVTYFSLAWWSLWNLFSFMETGIWGDPEARDVVSGLVMAEIPSTEQTLTHRGRPIIRCYTKGPEAVEEACWRIHSTHRPTLCPPVESLENSSWKQTLSLNLEDCVFVQNK